MRKVHLLMHVSLDGFVAGPNGEMDWIYIDDEMFDDVGKLTESADTALFGRVTYQMMEQYWPTAGEQPNASKHDIEHANWVNKATKLVFSRTLTHLDWKNSKLIRENIPAEITKLKQQAGKNMLMIGSATTAHFFMQHRLIDEFHIHVNPVVLGGGIPLFKDVKDSFQLNLTETKTYNSGVIALHYQLK